MAQEKKISGQTDDQQLQTNQPNNTPQALAGSTQSTASPSGRVANFSTGSTPGTSGSGRFTNIQKYISANENASGNLGAKANQTINKDFNQQQSQVNKQNDDIKAAFDKGRGLIDNDGKGFQQQLGTIGSGLQSGFTDFGNRGNAFTNATSQVNAFTQNKPQFDLYKNIASGSAIDNNALNASQQQAAKMSQDLLANAQKGVQNIETESGRDQLFSQVLQPKQGYTAGQRSFDKLFLGGALGDIRTNLQGNQNTAGQLVNATGIQGNNLNTLFNDESNLMTGLKTQAEKNQDLFNQALYGSATANDPQGNLARNLKQVNDARKQNYDNVIASLNSGTISQEQANALGLGSLNNTYINELQAKSGLGAGGEVVGPTANPKNLIGSYNTLSDKYKINEQVSQGADAMSARDITNQQDYDVYKALQDLALNRDTQMISGVSGLGSSIKADNLAKDISAADKAFKDQYAGKDMKYGRTATDGFGATYGTGVSANMDNYIKDANTWINSQRDVAGIDAADVDNVGRNIAATSGKNVRNEFKNRLDNIIGDTGVKNALTVDPTTPESELKKRFGSLV